jgi:hypothetical protein
MPASDSVDHLLTRLEDLKRRFDPAVRARIERDLAVLARRRFPDADSLLRFHEILLFLRAYPHSTKLLRQADQLLSSFSQWVAELQSRGEDLSTFEEPEVSGIAGTSFSTVLSYDIVRRLADLHPRQVDIDWESYEVSDRLAPVWRRLFPLLEDDSLVEAHVPYLDWLQAAMGRQGPTLRWLLHRLERLQLPAKDKAELYDFVELPVRWNLGNSRATRTRMRRPVRQIFYHQGPLLRRSQVSLAAELDLSPLPLRKLSPPQGEAVLNMARETSAMRFRELYGFTYGDPGHVLHADAGRGVEIFLCGVPPDRRLPLRAYHAALTVKNGVPIGYFETLSFFERMEVGFNLYYTFREGETAWLFARLLRLFQQVLGVTCSSVDPYQIGHHNEEAIESGAFWFYRKLGFRPVLAGVVRLAEAEARKIRNNPGYRTPARILRRLAVGHMIYETPGSSHGDWDRFHIRNLALAVQRRMSGHHRGDAARIRTASRTTTARVLAIPPVRSAAFENLALILALIPDLSRWTKAEKVALTRIIRAKSAPEESRYLRLLQRHPRLREAMLRLGS